jgi:hypothetical protein
VSGFPRVRHGLVVYILAGSIIDLLARAPEYAEHHDKPAPGPAAVARQADALQVQALPCAGRE